MTATTTFEERHYVVRAAMQELRGVLQDEYHAGHLYTEADVQAVVVRHLRDKLVEPDEDNRWRISACHRIGRVAPDVTCFYRPRGWSDFVRDTAEHAVAVIEIKWARDPSGDLGKLRRLQRWAGRRRKRRPALEGDAAPDLLAWTVYGDHFDKELHPTNQKKHATSRNRIRAWKRGNEKMRGTTIVELENEPLPSGDCARSAFREHWWTRSKHALLRKHGVA